MKRVALLASLLSLVPICSWALPAAAAPARATLTGGGWTLTLTYGQAGYGRIMGGAFRSAHANYEVQGDWIPAGDEGSDVLRLYGRPFGPKSPMGLVGVATLANTCSPTCVDSNRYRLTEMSVSPQISAKLPGVGRPSLLPRLHT